MFALLKRIRDGFNYYVFGRLAPEMIAKINDDKSLATEVKENLIASIMQNDPAKLLEQVNDDKNNIPTGLKEDLTVSIMGATQPQVAEPEEQVEELVEPDTTEEPYYSIMLDDRSYDKLTPQQLSTYLTQIERISLISKTYAVDDKLKDIILYTADCPTSPESYISNYQALPEVYGPNPLNEFDISVIKLANTEHMSRCDDEEQVVEPVQPTPTFKCILVGDGGVGKTAFVRRHLTGEFQQIYTPTLGVDVHPLVFNTNTPTKQVRFNVWDCAGQEKFSGLGSGYYGRADCAIIMFSLTSKLSFRSVCSWIIKVLITCGKIPFILVGTHNDVAEQSVTTDEIQPYLYNGIKYYPVSSKSNFNLGKPFLDLTKQLLGNDVQFHE